MIASYAECEEMAHSITHSRPYFGYQLWNIFHSMSHRCVENCEKWLVWGIDISVCKMAIFGSMEEQFWGPTLCLRLWITWVPSTFPVTKPTASKHLRKLKALTPTRVNHPPVHPFFIYYPGTGLSEGGAMLSLCHLSGSRGTSLTGRWTLLLLPPPRRLCFRRCLFVCLLATLHKNFQTDLREIFQGRLATGWWTMIKFRWQFGSRI